MTQIELYLPPPITAQQAASILGHLGGKARAEQARAPIRGEGLRDSCGAEATASPWIAVSAVAGTLELPWPPAKLSPNGSHGSHWAWATAGRKYHRDCAILLKSQPVPKLFVDHVMVELAYCPPTKRLCDLDNLLARTKHGIDALAEALGVDDQIFEYWLRRGEPAKGGKVLVRLHFDELAVAA